MLVALKFWPSLSALTTGAFLGLSHLGWICFRHHVAPAGDGLLATDERHQALY